MIKKMIFHTIEELEKQLYDFKIIFAYHSNKIENDNIDFHDTRDIFEKGTVTGYTGNLRTLYEIENQVKCYEFIKPFIIEKQQLDIDFIKKVHYKLTNGTYDEHRYIVNGERAGEFKKHDYITGVNEVGSYPHEVEDDLNDLLKEVYSYVGEDYFTVGVFLHAVFENIHPFADGNGRVGRTLMNYYFMVHDIAPVIIYNEDKKEYYHALECFDAKEDLEPLKKFIEKEQEKTWISKNKNNHKSLACHI